jgi:hypothetical protein
MSAWWVAISVTVLGDILATAIAITGMAILFLAVAFGTVAAARACSFMLRLVGAG